jgi:ferritin
MQFCFFHQVPASRTGTLDPVNSTGGTLSTAIALLKTKPITSHTGDVHMLTKTMEEALNRQVNREIYSSYLYLGMSAYFETTNLKGFAGWMRIQSDEERAHAMKFYDYIIARQGKVSLDAIEAPKAKWTSAGKVFEEVYAHEQKVTGMIDTLVDLAIREKDHATFELLQWFVKEQVEEEANAVAICEKIKTIGDVPGHLFYLDHELAKRK